MVFHDARRRRKAPAPKLPNTTINSLPMELLLQVLTDTPTPDLLKMRETSTLFANAGIEMLRKRLKTLYIHPTKTSLRRAIAICNSDLCNEIEEICLVSKILWHDMQQRLAAPRYQSARGRLLNNKDWAPDDFRPWPSQMPDVNSESGRRYSPHEWGYVYSELLEALAKLPRASKLFFTDSCQKPGFNQVSLATINAWAVRCAKPQRVVEEKDVAHLNDSSVFSDADCIFALLGSSHFKFSSLRITDEIPFVREHRRTARCKSPCHKFLVDQLARLTTVEFHLSTGWDETEWQRTIRAILHQTVSLQSLTLKLQYNAAVVKARLETTFHSTLTGLVFPDLHTLEIVALLPEPQKGRLWRPVPSGFDFSGFLAPHRQSLKALLLDNVIFAHPDDGKTTFEQCRDVLQLADRHIGYEELSGKDIFDPKAGFELSWIVNNYQQDPRCKNKGQGHVGHPCRYECGILCPMMYGEVKTVDFGAFALGLGVPLDNKRGVWELEGLEAESTAAEGKDRGQPGDQA